MLKIAGIIPESFTDGNGIRYVIFTQGCAHNCLNCHNPETHPFNTGIIADYNKIISDLSDNPLLDGVTLSGGDPFYQAEDCTELLKIIKDKNKDLSIWCYTGFTYEDILKDKKMAEMLKYIDILVDGEYIDKLRSLSLRFRGSSNQRIIDIQKSLKTNSLVDITSEYN